MALGNIHIFCSITVNLTNLSRLDTFVCQICFAIIVDFLCIWAGLFHPSSGFMHFAKCGQCWFPVTWASLAACDVIVSFFASNNLFFLFWDVYHPPSNGRVSEWVWKKMTHVVFCNRDIFIYLCLWYNFNRSLCLLQFFLSRRIHVYFWWPLGKSLCLADENTNAKIIPRWVHC